MDFKTWVDVATALAGFALGVAIVHRLQKSRASEESRSSPGPSMASSVDASRPRPSNQIRVLGFSELVEVTRTGTLLGSIERRTRFSASAFDSDCRPVLEAFAAFVQQLPASEAHHHAQPGGLWIHALEVVDAALTFRAGQEIPPRVDTEERKRLEHRWTFGIFAAALLHDVGKPVTDVRVILYGEDSYQGRAWAPLAGAMTAQGALWYAVTFATPSDRDYRAHAKLAGMLLHAFVPSRILQWLSEDGDVLTQLLGYLSGEDPDGTIGRIVKRADSDSVRRNLAHGPRTRFASARVRPLIERLMEALQRMLQEGGSLPLNRPGAAGWVTADGKVWFVCARLADEVRAYLAQHESAAGVPGKDRNDRLFDTWQEHGAVVISPDGGAIWRVLVECDNWSSPDVLTVLCFELGRLFASPHDYPPAMRGRILPQYPGAVASIGGTTSRPATATAPSPQSATATATVAPHPPAARPAVGAPVVPESAAARSVPLPQPPNAGPEPQPSAEGPSQGADVAGALPPGVVPADAVEEPVSERAAPVAPGAGPAAVLEATHGPQQVHSSPQGGVRFGRHGAAPVASQADGRLPQSSGEPPHADNAHSRNDEDTLPASESAAAELSRATATSTPVLGAPLRPKDKGHRPTATTLKGPSEAVLAFMAWVANGVGSGDLKYNEDGAMVHFVPEGVLLLSPEIFRRFLEEHAAVSGGPIAVLRESHGDRAYKRLQNELGKSGWSRRNGDENLHYYAFLKADKTLSRAASFYLVLQPERFWNPLPPANGRIRPAPRPIKSALSPEVLASAASQSKAAA